MSGNENGAKDPNAANFSFGDKKADTDPRTALLTKELDAVAKSNIHDRDDMLANALARGEVQPVDTADIIKRQQEALGAKDSGDPRDAILMTAAARGEVAMPDATSMINQRLDVLKADKEKVENILKGIAADKLSEKARTTDSEDPREVAFAAALASGKAEMPDLEGTYKKELDNINVQIAKGEAELAQEQQKNRDRQKMLNADRARISEIQKDIQG